MTPQPYYADEHVQLFHGDFRELAVLVLDGREPDLVMADPPYGETQLEWDTWPSGWPTQVPGRSMWCFGSMRMFLDRSTEFPAGDWKLSQDAIWEKQTGSAFATDRLYRVHETALHWYRGPWAEVHHDTPRTSHQGPNKTVMRRRKAVPQGHHGVRNDSLYVDDGSRLLRSVLYAPNMHGKAINETEKPIGLLEPLIAYGCPKGGLILDVFAGSSSSLVAARATGRRAIDFELREQQCERAARRLSQGDLFAGLGDAS